MPEVMEQFPLELKNRFNCLSLEDEQHGNTSQDGDEVAHDSKEEKKLTKITENYCSIDLCYATEQGKAEAGVAQRTRKDKRSGEV